MKYFNLITALAFMLLYFLGYLPPSEHVSNWVLYFLIPLVLILNILFFLVAILRKQKTALFYLLALVVGGNYLLSTIGIKWIFNHEESQVKNTFTVLNYNVSGFNESWKTGFGRYPDYKPDSTVTRLKDWVAACDADVQCYQEFLHLPDGLSMDVLSAISAKGFHYYFSTLLKDSAAWGLGTLIVSRYPIINSGFIMESWNGYNRVTFADIIVHEDTIRVINVHLQSMRLKESNPLYANGIHETTQSLKDLWKRLGSGIYQRSKQINMLVEFIEASPYPLLCVGDFNELPYSYSYHRMKKNTKNAFEERGKGFGFTYHGKTLNMLRIDNQFYSPPLRVRDFQTLYNVKYTDHFPLMGEYELIK